MCGIVGFIGKKQAAPILLEGLSRLEYRGYDSAGLAVRDGDSPIEIVKAKGRLSVLSEKTNGGKSLRGCVGIGHTRWATHGEPSETNAHPHISFNKSVVAVHNGIIENFQELKDRLTKKGYRFYSETDTEVAVNLVEYYYQKYNQGALDAISRAMMRIRGSYAMEFMFADLPGEIYAARKDAPMIIGVAGGETYVLRMCQRFLNIVVMFTTSKIRKLRSLAKERRSFSTLILNRSRSSLSKSRWMHRPPKKAASRTSC